MTLLFYILKSNLYFGLFINLFEKSEKFKWKPENRKQNILTKTRVMLEV